MAGSPCTRLATASILQEGVERLKALGFEPVASLVQGEPAKVIARFAHEVSADLVVVGHRKQSAVARWWSGSTDAYLMDHIGCTLLVARNTITDDQFETAFGKGRTESVA